ncbi:hypothetical protein TNCV_2667341 [Trichonephila clavipes]|nr:hypothetical protein TNCV_2667341 [Trichonephila clavipes]
MALYRSPLTATLWPSSFLKKGKRGELLGRIDRQNSRFRTAKTTIIEFGLPASIVELESAKSAVNEKEYQKNSIISNISYETKCSVHNWDNAYTLSPPTGINSSDNTIDHFNPTGVFRILFIPIRE